MELTTKEEQLRPCPFCGQTASLIEHIDRLSSKPYFYVSCNHYECTCRPITRWYKTPDKAIEAWNRRSDT